MSDNINNMDFKQLRNEVQLLRDELAIMKRKYEDIIYNLDTDNFSSRFVKEQGDMRTAIEINAEGIKTKVSNEEFDSAMTQTAEKIETEVKNREDADKQLSSKITQTAEEISTSVSKQITIQFKSIVMPTKNNTSDVEKGMLCEYDGTLYYYNDILEDWDEYPHDGVNSKFIQTANGFKFTNDVKIDADLIVSGTLSADRIDTDNLSCTRLYAKGNYNGYSVRLNGRIGDFGIFNGDAGENASANDANCIYGVYNTFPNINFYVYSNNFMGYDVTEEKVWTKGDWDFSVANVEGLEDSGYATKEWVLNQLG